MVNNIFQEDRAETLANVTACCSTAKSQRAQAMGKLPAFVTVMKANTAALFPAVREQDEVGSLMLRR